MKKSFTNFIIYTLIAITISVSTFAQEDKAITLVVNGQGKTADEAKQSALRNAIEQAFGTFISSKTDILNDQLIKDEIVSVSNGNIQKFEVLSDGQLPDGSFYSTLKATVSVSKLTTFCESKGIRVEFKGSLFSFNINQQKINEENELKAIQDMSVISKKIIDKSFNFNLNVAQPISYAGKDEFWKIPITIEVHSNKNFFQVPQLFSNTLSGLSLSTSEVEDYLSLGKNFYPILFISKSGQQTNINAYFLRNTKSVENLFEIIFYFKEPILNAKISNGISVFSLSDIVNEIKKNGKLRNDRLSVNLNIDDQWFRPYIYKSIEDRSYKTGSIFHLDEYGDKKIRFTRDFPGGEPESYLLKKEWYEKFSFYLITSFTRFDKLIEIKFNDIRSLDEVNKITEYKIMPTID